MDVLRLLLAYFFLCQLAVVLTWMCLFGGYALLLSCAFSCQTLTSFLVASPVLRSPRFSYLLLYLVAFVDLFDDVEAFVGY